MTNPSDHTTSDSPITVSGSTTADTTAADAHVSGGSADRLDSPGEGSGGLPGAGADGETGAREALRKDLGERSESAGTETGGDLSEPLGATDDPEGGSVQANGAST